MAKVLRLLKGVKKQTWALFVVLLLALILRGVNLGEFRPIGPDELTWLMVGESLLTTGVPETWSLYRYVYSYPPSEQVAEIYIGGVSLWPSVRPYLDHPPLFSLVIGKWALMTDSFSAADRSIKWEIVRLPMLGVAIMTLGLTYFLVKRLWGQGQAFFTLLAFSFFPSHLVTSRFITPEHALGMLLVLALYLFVLFEASNSVVKRRWLLIGLALISIVAPLLKLFGVVVPLTLMLLALWRRRFRVVVLISMLLLASLGLYAWYGYHFGWRLFMAVMQAHHDQTQSMVHFWTLFTRLDVGHYQFFDPSMIVGLIGILALVVQPGKRKVGEYLFAPLLVISLLFIYIAPVYFWGWYKYLIYPFVAIGLGHFFWRLYRAEWIYLFLFIPLLGVMIEQAGLVDSQSYRRSLMVMLYLLFIIVTTGAWRPVVSRGVFVAALVVLFASEVIWVLRVLG